MVEWWVGGFEEVGSCWHCCHPTEGSLCGSGGVARLVVVW